MPFDHYETIKFDRTGNVLTVTLNRPDRLNAVSVQMHHELSTLFRDISADKQSDVVILTGAGRAFSAGGDLDHLEQARQDPALFYEDMRQGKQLIFSLLDCDKPVICRLNGDAIGLGATIALFCDIIIAADDARIGDPHVRVGYAAGDGGAVIWPQLIGYARAKQYLLTGDLIGAKEAQQIGLINFAVPRKELDATVDKWASRLARGATLATRWTKATINVSLKQIASAVIEPGLVYEALCGRTEDHAEALKAMREKRSPVFHGR
jgi:enoyl-CoA hydratase